MFNVFRHTIARLNAVCGALCLAALSAGAALAAYPDRALRIVVPFTPGGGTDIIARALGDQITKDLGQPVVIDNKPGAGTIIGTDAVAKSRPARYVVVD
jgi:tripartite-type tricarboxylate transporter receptor subunit TctC